MTAVTIGELYNSRQPSLPDQLSEEMGGRGEKEKKEDKKMDPFFFFVVCSIDKDRVVSNSIFFF